MTYKTGFLDYSMCVDLEAGSGMVLWDRWYGSWRLEEELLGLVAEVPTETTHHGIPWRKQSNCVHVLWIHLGAEKFRNCICSWFDKGVVCVCTTEMVTWMWSLNYCSNLLTESVMLIG